MITTKGKRPDPKSPHWIVKRMTKFGPGEFRPRVFFLHATQELAEAEARRLAETNPGQRFSVYASAASFKIAKPAAAVEAPVEAAAA